MLAILNPQRFGGLAFKYWLQELAAML